MWHAITNSTQNSIWMCALYLDVPDVWRAFHCHFHHFLSFRVTFAKVKSVATTGWEKSGVRVRVASIRELDPVTRILQEHGCRLGILEYLIRVYNRCSQPLAKGEGSTFFLKIWLYGSLMFIAFLFLNDKSRQEMIRLKVMLIYCSVRSGWSMLILFFKFTTQKAGSKHPWIEGRFDRSPVSRLSDAEQQKASQAEVTARLDAFFSILQAAESDFHGVFFHIFSQLHEPKSKRESDRNSALNITR